MENNVESKTIDSILDVVEYFALGVELLAVAILVVGISWATYGFLIRRDVPAIADRQVLYRRQVGNTLLIALEVLVAADVVRTIAVEPSLESLGILGLLVLIRTFLSWSLEVEVEHRWPWKQPPELGSRSSEPLEQ
jgi:uncharacterized membrane protein